MDETTQQRLEQQIRFADQLARSYVLALTRLRASGRRAVGGGTAYRKDSLETGVAEATRLADNLIDAARDATATAAAAGVEGVPGSTEAIEAPELNEEERALIRLDEARAAAAAIRGLQAGLPQIDWSDPSGDLDVDLFASKKRTALIIGGLFAAVAITLAFFYPVPALVVGSLAVFVAGRPIAREIIWRR